MPDKYEEGDEVRMSGWENKRFVTLTERIVTPKGDKGWRGWRSEGGFTHLRDGSFTPRRGKRKRQGSTK